MIKVCRICDMRVIPLVLSVVIAAVVRQLAVRVRPYTPVCRRHKVSAALGVAYPSAGISVGVTSSVHVAGKVVKYRPVDRFFRPLLVATAALAALWRLATALKLTLAQPVAKPSVAVLV